VQTFRKRRAGLSATAGLSCLFWPSVVDEAISPAQRMLLIIISDCRLVFRWISVKLHYTDTGYGHVVQHRQRTSSQQFYNKFATSQYQIGKFLTVGGEFVMQQD